MSCEVPVELTEKAVQAGINCVRGRVEIRRKADLRLKKVEPFTEGANGCKAGFVHAEASAAARIENEPGGSDRKLADDIVGNGGRQFCHVGTPDEDGKILVDVRGGVHLRMAGRSEGSGTASVKARPRNMAAAELGF
jgi:hypothetical protein